MIRNKLFKRFICPYKGKCSRRDEDLCAHGKEHDLVIGEDGEEHCYNTCNLKEERFICEVLCEVL